MRENSPKAKNGGDGEGGLHFLRRAELLARQSRRDTCERPKGASNIIKHTDESPLEDTDNVVWLFFLLTNCKKAQQWWACNKRNDVLLVLNVGDARVHLIAPIRKGFIANLFSLASNKILGIFR